ncbi:MAG: GntR family transcriptional regulator [Rubellimicrobium sp.]|nr:GntR family transcriptional regulator [Rubellimicrobium sp.]
MSAALDHQMTAMPPGPDGGAAPSYLYETVRDLLAARIGSGDLPEGAILKEAHLASQLGTSRAPVRRALAMLAESGLIRPARGQGYVVGRAARGTMQMSSRELHEILRAQGDDIDRSATWERIFDQVVDEVSACMPFGTYRIQEGELGDHHNVSRTVAREVLWRLTDRRLIEKDRKSHWIVGQMTARDLHETFEMRRLLEPQALAHVAPDLERDWLEALSARVGAAIDTFPASGPAEMDAIDQAMFQSMYRGLRNSRMHGSIQRNQISLLVSRQFRHHFPMIDDLPALRDHAQILHHLRQGAVDVAQILLRNHLQRAEPLSIARLRVLSVLPPPRRVAWLTAIH